MKLAIISGGSRGLGAALCEAYAHAGFDLLEFSRSAPHPFSVTCDFAQPHSVAEAVSARLSTYGNTSIEELVILSNAATLEPIEPSTQLDASRIQQNLNISFVSAIVFMSEALRHFRGHDCRKTLVNVSTGAALKGYAGWSLYCASKAGLENHVRAIAAEQQLEAHPFDVLSIDPGVMDTAMQGLIRKTSPENFPALERFLTLHEEGMLRSPFQIADAILRITAHGQHESGARLQATDFLSAAASSDTAG